MALVIFGIGGWVGGAGVIGLHSGCLEGTRACDIREGCGNGGEEVGMLGLWIAAVTRLGATVGVLSGDGDIWGRGGC